MKNNVKVDLDISENLCSYDFSGEIKNIIFTLVDSIVSDSSLGNKKIRITTKEVGDVVLLDIIESDKNFTFKNEYFHNLYPVDLDRNSKEVIKKVHEIGGIISFHNRISDEEEGRSINLVLKKASYSMYKDSKKRKVSKIIKGKKTDIIRELSNQV